MSQTASGETPGINTSYLVSIVTAVFNGGAEIDATLHSALNQDYPAIEVIVIDGGSTDGTQGKILAFGERIAHFVSEHDKGIGDAWNKGLKISKGEFVAFLNCGDEWPIDYVSRHMSALSSDPNVIQYGTTFMTEAGKVVDRIDREFDPSCLPDGFGFMHTSVMTSKSVYEKVGPFDIRKRIAVDTDWMLRALRAGVDFRKVSVYNFMAHGGISSKQWLRGQFEYVKSLRLHGFVTGVRKLVIKKTVQAIYLKLGFHKRRRYWKVQMALISVAMLNFWSRVVPWQSLRLVAWKFAGMTIHSGAVIHQGVRVFASRRLEIGCGTIINRRVMLDNRSLIKIGSHVSIAHDCRIYTTCHDYQSPDFCIVTKPVVIEDYAVLFAGAVLMPGITIGQGAVVLPFSVVTQDVAPMTVVGGVPASMRATRTAELRYRLDYDYWFAT